MASWALVGLCRAGRAQTCGLPRVRGPGGQWQSPHAAGFMLITPGGAHPLVTPGMAV
ncbi:hypothetical protein CBM2633_A140020 [Cupriavidus taiwanensis]|nr:hypothetical protein CBM2626_A250020 [Cupriavidus taiwanensis]SPA12664.1 hypothetical protein CBM2633_A140020 [Cupriavidus taiwanensis]